MKRLVAVLVALVVVSLGASGCGLNPAPAVTVRGTDVVGTGRKAEKVGYSFTISDAAVTAELKAVEGNTAYLKAKQEAASQSGSTESILGRSPGSFDANYVAEIVRVQLLLRLVSQALDHRSIKVTSDQIGVAREQLKDSLQYADPSTGKSVDLLARFPKEYQDELATRNASVVALQYSLAGVKAAPGQSAEEAYFEANQDEFLEACSRHILLENEADAEKAKARLDAGEDFAKVAGELSTDTGTKDRGGDLGCARPSLFVPEFGEAITKAPLNEVVGPVQTSFGFHLIEVSKRTAPDFETVAADVRERILEETQQPLLTLINEMVADATFRLNPRYGTLTKQPDGLFQITPPNAPTDAPTTTTRPKGSNGSVPDPMLEPEGTGQIER